MYGKLVDSEPTALNANGVLGKLPDMTSWASNLLKGHRSEEVSHKLNKVKDARVGRWTSIGYAKQVFFGMGALMVPLRSSLDARSSG